MTKRQFEELKEKFGYDFAINKLYREVNNPKFVSYIDLKTKIIRAVENDDLDTAIKILNVVNNPPELDCGFYFYDKKSGEPPVNLDNIDLIEKYIGFDKEN